MKARGPSPPQTNDGSRPTRYRGREPGSWDFLSLLFSWLVVRGFLRPDTLPAPFERIFAQYFAVRDDAVDRLTTTTPQFLILVENRREEALAGNTLSWPGPLLALRATSA